MLSDFGFRISDFRCQRRGVSILEVLFAIMVTTIGLLGAIAVFPAASSQAKKGRINDAIAVAGPQAVHQFDAMGMRNIGSWVGWSQPWDQANPPPNWGLVAGMNFPVGTSFCIDPGFIAANSGTANQANTFPYGAAAGTPRMFRVSLDTLGTGMPMDGRVAARTFIFDDDLAFHRPDDRSLLPGQLFDTIPEDDGVAAGTPKRISARQSEGHLSWIATLVPKLERRNPVPTDTFVLSIVMFNDRPIDATLTPAPERVVNIDQMPGLGVTGGEVRLTTAAASEDAAEVILKVRPGDWLMLQGNVVHQDVDSSSTVTAALIPVFQWYRVSSVDPEVEVITAGTTYGRYVTLMGEDWNTSAIVGTAPGYPQAVLVDGVVGVYEKTIRLEIGP